MEIPVVVNKRFSGKVLLVTAATLAALLVLLMAAKKRQELRERAAVEGGPAQVLLTPLATDIPAGSPFSLTLSSLTQSLPIDGIQIVARLSGAVPADIAFTPQLPAGLKTVRNSLRQEGGGTIHELVYTTPDPSAPPFLANDSTILGAYAMTAPGSGTMTVSFDTALSKILQNRQAKDILRFPQTQTYTFVPAPTYTPTPTPTPVVNLLENGSFETDANADRIPDGWKGSKLTKRDRLTTDVSHTGSASFQFAPSKNNKKLSQTLKDPRQAGSTFTISGFVRSGSIPASGSRSLVVVVKYHKDKRDKFVLDLPIQEVNTWSEAKGTIILPKDAVSLIVKIYNDNVQADTFLDDATLSESDPQAPQAPLLTPQEATPEDIED